MLQRLARAAVRYGVEPEDIGPISTFTDEDYMVHYLSGMKQWEAPSFYGCTAKHQERARREWDKLIAKVAQSFVGGRSQKIASIWPFCHPKKPACRSS
jgi:lipopolysaccharide biosynthesis glycosyltransferase